MRAGTLRHRLIIQQRTEALDTTGYPAVTWATRATRWGEVRATSGGEFSQRAELIGNATHAVTFRNYDAIVPTDRILWGTRYLSVNLVQHDPRTTNTIAFCTEAT
jgi:head-tail adaptor